ncbi:MAG: sigma-70 family RNA polymerase sigma factor [Acidimicrobiia bacterium]|nr:sigma-70 family RNA polymerase sigma factor [Acidimicrobiia bacterium]
MGVTLRPFEEIVAEHGAVVMRVCRALLRPAEADDAWSETFLAALRTYPDLRPDSNVRGWLVTIAHSKAIDILRRSARAPRPTADVPERRAAAAPAERGDPVDDDLVAALRRLPTKQRQAVVMRYLADLAYADVASALGSTQAAARRSAADGIAALRAALTRTRPDLKHNDPKGPLP